MRMSQYKSFGYGRQSPIEQKIELATPARQDACLAYITHCIKTSAIPPSVEEMRKHLGLASKSNVHRILTLLESRGKIRRMAHRARAIEVVGLEFPASPPSYPRPVPVMETSVGHKFFKVEKDGPEADAKLVEMGR